MSDQNFLDTVSVPPSRLSAGDVIHDETGQRAVEIHELHPTIIEYHGENIAVWAVSGEDTRPLKGNRKVKMLFVPRTPVQVILSRGGVANTSG